MKEIVINNVSFGGESMGLILGPCVIESRDHSLIMAESIYKITNRLGFKVVWELRRGLQFLVKLKRK